MPHSGGVPKKAEEIVKEYAAVLERYIARYPEQWYIFDNYWIDKQ